MSKFSFTLYSGGIRTLSQSFLDVNADSLEAAIENSKESFIQNCVNFFKSNVKISYTNIRNLTGYDGVIESQPSYTDTSKYPLHKYFGRNLISANYEPGFEFKPAKDYRDVFEWLANVFMVENENYSLKTSTHNKVHILDKRLGHSYSTMGCNIPIEFIEKLKRDVRLAEIFLIKYFYKHNYEAFRSLDK